jgi:hypothetical protein
VVPDERDKGAGPDEGDEASPAVRRSAVATPKATIAAVGFLLGIGFFPFMYSKVAPYDDEGYFLAILRQFLQHGSLYVNTKSSYGPFYFSLVGAIYRLTGQSPTPFTGRLIVLLLTVLSVVMFGATVWRVTKSVAFAVLCEVVTFGVLIIVAAREPLHPGSLVAFLLSLLVFALASYAMDQRNVFLYVAGGVVGALLMTKINVGLFAVAAIVIAFVVGNDQYGKRLRVTVATGGVLLPFVLMSQKLWQAPRAEFALLVGLGLLLTYVPMQVDVVSLPRRALLVMAESAVVVMVVSFLWPLADGTGPTAIVTGVLIRPLRQAGIRATITPISFDWAAFLITIGVVGAVLLRRDRGRPKLPGPSWIAPAALGAAGLYVVGLGTLSGTRLQLGFLAWLPGIAMLPALAWIAAAPPRFRLVLRLLVPLSILQILHAYPVAGSQRGWGMVAMCVPCVLALSFAAKRVPLWVQARRAVRGGVVGGLCLVLLIGAGLSPLTAWHNYTQLTPLDVRGARLVRLPAPEVKTLRTLTALVKRRCDTFYSAPGFDSLYIYTGLPAPTGLLSNWPGALTTDEQRQLVKQLARAQASGERVCIVRDLTRAKLWLSSSYGTGPLGQALSRYKRRIGQVALYSVSVLGTPGSTG